MENITIFVDESGNMGRGRGRYFTISCVAIDSSREKSLRRKMKKLTLKIKKNFPLKEWKNREVKAGLINKKERSKLLARLPEYVNIYNIIVDKHHLKDHMFEDKSASYNYWTRLIIDNILRDNEDCRNIVINVDRRSIKTGSKNTFEDYINIRIKYELCKDINLQVLYPESHTDYGIQVADFISNAVNYTALSGGDKCLYTEISSLVKRNELFPRWCFE